MPAEVPPRHGVGARRPRWRMARTNSWSEAGGWEFDASIGVGGMGARSVWSTRLPLAPVDYACISLTATPRLPATSSFPVPTAPER